MTFYNWIQLSSLIDIFSIVFIMFLVIKNRKLNKQIDSLQAQVNDIKDDLSVCIKSIKNPAAARRALNKK
jgi:hypothetical protein